MTRARSISIGRAVVAVGALTLLAACGGDEGAGSQPSIAEPVTVPAAPSPHELATQPPSDPTAATIATPPTSNVMPPTTVAEGKLPHLPATTTPPTTLAGPAAPPPAPPSTRVLSGADEAEPTCAAVLAGSVRGAAAPGAELSRLEPMLGQLVAYGQLHPDVFGGYGLVWHGPDDGSAFVGITVDVAAHRHALEAAVDHPDELIVCRSPLSEAEQSALNQALEPELQSRGVGWGSTGAGVLAVQLGDDDQAYAAELHAQYGEMVQLTVGRFPYPMPDPLPAASCEPLPDGRSVDGFEAVVDPPSAPLQPTGDGQPRLAVHLRNTGATDVSVLFGQPRALLLAAGTDRVVGTYTGAVTLALDVVTIRPGEEAAREALVGAAACDPAMGYRLPPGRYDLVVLLEGTVMDGPPLVTPRITVELAAP
jgi:hypothetical protein